jgi:hypothetical protein
MSDSNSMGPADSPPQKTEEEIVGEKKAAELIMKLFRERLSQRYNEHRRLQQKKLSKKKVRKTIADKSRRINRFKVRMKKGWKRKKSKAAVAEKTMRPTANR